jgi:Flp pilus assembly pilin Flp
MCIQDLRTFIADDQGGALVEYAVISAVAAIPMIFGLAGMVLALQHVLQTTGSGLTNINVNP